MTTTEYVNSHSNEAPEPVAPLLRPLSRRGFVTKGMAIVGLGGVLPAAFVRAAFAEGTPPGVGAKRRVLVVLQLGGGNDGLNTVIPYSDGAYYDARPRIGVPQEQVLRLDDRVGLHPSMTGIKSLYDAGKLALIQGVGYEDPSRSHFRAMEIWHTASTEENVPTGWLGRLLDATHQEQQSLWRAASIGTELSESLASEGAFVPSIASPQTYGLQMDGNARSQAARRTTDWVRLYAQQASLGGALALLSKTGTDAYESTNTLRTATANYQPMATYPGNALATALRTSAQLITSNLGTGICYVTTGGFDTHAGQGAQGGTQANLLRAVSDSVAAFYADLTARGIDAEVTTMMWTEFGRRVRENGSAGTDHGTATPVFVFGGGVKGGLFGETPSMRDLDSNGDLKFNVDFRAVYSTILGRWFATDPKDVLPGQTFAELPLFA